MKLVGYSIERTHNIKPSDHQTLCKTLLIVQKVSKVFRYDNIYDIYDNDSAAKE